MKITSPVCGECINLWTEKQREYFATDRSGYQVEDFYYLDLKNLQKEDDSKSSLTPFTWEPKCVAELQISEGEDFSDFLSYFGNGVALVDNLKIGTRYFVRVVCGDDISPIIDFVINRTPSGKLIWRDNFNAAYKPAAPLPTITTEYSECFKYIPQTYIIIF